MSEDCCSEIRDCLEGSYDSRYESLPELVPLDIDKAIQSGITGAGSAVLLAPEGNSKAVAGALGGIGGFVFGGIGDVVETVGSHLHYNSVRAGLEAEIELERQEILDSIPSYGEFRDTLPSEEFAQWVYFSGIDLPEDQRREYFRNLSARTRSIYGFI